jgi:hypothetical protein
MLFAEENCMPLLSSRISSLLLLVLASASVMAAEPLVPPGYRLIFQTPTKFILVFCNGDLEGAKAQRLVADVQAAYDFVIETEQWRSREPLTVPLHVHVNAEMKKEALGFSTKNVVTIGLSYLGNPLAQGTLAHELTHCQDARQRGSHPLPHYLSEGRALLVGRAYREKLGQEPDAYDRQIKNHIVRFTAQDAEEVLREGVGQKLPPSGPELVRLAFMGCFFVDFMRTHLEGGLADIQPRTARLVEDMGQGMSYEDAFQKEVGVSLEEAKKAFVAHVDNTKDKPAERLKGTVWQDL